jgi:hypothetical protein
MGNKKASGGLKIRCLIGFSINKQIGMNVFALAVESMGLYGTCFGVGVSILDPDTDLEMAHLYVACSAPHRAGPFNCQNPEEVRHKFWDFYLQWYQKCHVVIGSGSPVEANFIRSCVLDDAENRTSCVCYPMHEWATLALLNPPRKDLEWPDHVLERARQLGHTFIEEYNHLLRMNVSSSSSSSEEQVC